MGLVTTMGKFCYIECDTLNCGKKIEKSGENLLRELAYLCGWQSRGNQWVCPNCAEKEKAKRMVRRAARPKRKVQAAV